MPYTIKNDHSDRIQCSYFKTSMVLNFTGKKAKAETKLGPVVRISMNQWPAHAGYVDASVGLFKRTQKQSEAVKRTDSIHFLSK